MYMALFRYKVFFSSHNYVVMCAVSDAIIYAGRFTGHYLGTTAYKFCGGFAVRFGPNSETEVRRLILGQETTVILKRAPFFSLSLMFFFLILRIIHL